MKIKNVSVFDPRDYGLFERPIISMVLSEELFSNSDEVIVTHDGHEWSTRRYGPFVKYECSTSPSRNTAGHYNVTFRESFPAVVDVRIHIRNSSGGQYILPGNFALPLKRARQYLRQYDLPWRLLMNDHDGQQGLVSWTPVHRPPKCKFMVNKSDDQTCEDPAIQTVFTRGIDFPLCEEHLFVHNEDSKSARLSSR